ncbi:MAG: acyltransferase family protein [Bacteroidota bacterium]
MTRADRPTDPSSKRLLSLDLFRGATMLLLVAEGTRLYRVFLDYTPEGSWSHTLATQFSHHAWNGLYFWDLIQPFFMFIVGVAMVFSLKKRVRSEEDWPAATRHILRRCGILLALGVILHCGYSGELVWELWNVLSQLSVTILIAYLIVRWPLRSQLLFSLGLLLGVELLYRFFPVTGFDQPFVMGENAGSWFDLLLMGKTSGGGWVAINALPTAAHTIWGVLAGKILADGRPEMEKVKVLAVAGTVALTAGLLLDWTGVTPIIKRISTSSFVFASGGWALLVLALCYWWIDIKGHQRGIYLFSVVGMNSIFIYMFAETVGKQWLNGYLSIFTEGILEPLGLPAGGVALGTALTALAVQWYLCHFLYRKRVLIKI